MMKSYSEMKQLPTFLERYRYLKLSGKVGDETFGYSRYLNQILYRSREWKQLRSKVIDRDKGCDLACEDHEIRGRNILIHHINPITLEDIYNRDPKVFDMENLVCVSLGTHNAIHYGDESKLAIGITERSENDTCPWK
jgi:hypothetical protein